MGVYKDYSKSCCYCGREFNHHIHRTADHLIPVSKGGANGGENKRNCCQHCNTQKKDLMPHDYLEYLLQEDAGGSRSARLHLDAKIENVRNIVAYVNGAGEGIFANRKKYEWFRRRYLKAG
ncbi:HNH endonuclease [Paraflavisolibacter sp. H34]|uniref:HNH endonuclease n=1 Tax=Huijunlia imazamoxiresistens TaxID=3127457 RepID=UPI00301A4D5F